MPWGEWKAGKVLTALTACAAVLALVALGNGGRYQIDSPSSLSSDTIVKLPRNLRVLRDGAEADASSSGGTLFSTGESTLPEPSAAAAATIPKRCDFGSLPGRWVGQRWTVYDPSCQLRDLVESHLVSDPATNARTMQEGEPRPEVGILLVGDSVDRMVVELGCPEAPPMLAPGEEAPAFRCRICRLPRITLANYAIWGVLSEGPYLEGRTQSAATRVPMAFELFRNATGREPDMVVLSSNFWDIGAMRMRSREVIDTQDDLPEDFLRTWQRDAAAAFQLVQSLAAPEAQLVWHTLHYPRMDPETGRHRHETVGRHAHVAQLNAAGRYVASLFPRWHVVDFELMAARWWREEQYLRDNVHPNLLLTHETLNVYLNLLRAAAGAPRDSAEMGGSTAAVAEPGAELASAAVDGNPSVTKPAE